MQVTCTPDSELDGATVVTPAGRLDALGATQLWDAAAPFVTEAAPSLLVDMSKVDIMSSAGISTLIRFLTHVKQLGGKLSVYGCNGGVRKVFKIVGLEPLLNVCDTAEEARARVKA